MTYKTMHRCIGRFARALDTPHLNLIGPVETDEVYAPAGLRGRERNSWLCSRDLFTRGRGSYERDKPPVFAIVGRGMGQRYVVPTKSANESTVRLLLADHKEESLVTYADGFRAYGPLEDDSEFTRKYAVHGGGEYAGGDVHVNNYKSHTSLTRR